MEQKEQMVDPLQRVFVPIEKTTGEGTRVFRTSDHQMYVRMEDGSIHRVHSAKTNLNGKAARRRQKRQRLEARTKASGK